MAKLSDAEKLILKLAGYDDPTEEMLIKLAEDADVSPAEFIRAAGVYILHRDAKPQAS
jgi:hypothetical protein